MSTLREIYAKGRHPSQEDKESAAHTIAALIEQAQAIGHRHVLGEQESRGMAWGGNFLNALQSGWDIVNSFVQRIGNWISDQFSSGDDPTPEEIQDEIDEVAGHAGDFEIQSAVESEVLRALTFVGVKMVKVEAQPDACVPCRARAEQGAVPIDEFEPPPYHGKCRCATVEAGED